MSVEITPPITVLVVEQSVPRVVTEQTTETLVAITEGGRGPAGNIGPAGTTGAPGPTGPTGPAGLSGAAAASYEHVQNAVSDTWTIVHNLGFRPNVTTFDSGGSVVEGDVSYPDLNAVIAHFTSAFAGGAYVS